MALPGYAAEASLYKTSNHYHVTATSGILSDGNTTVTPQGCGIGQAIGCFAFVAGVTIVCGGACASGIVPACVACVLGVGALGTYVACHDCLPDAITSVADQGLSGGGDGGTPVPRCCPQGRTCRCGGRCVTNPNGTISCVNGECLTPNQQCQ
jgi:hypothetical protein